MTPEGRPRHQAPDAGHVCPWWIGPLLCCPLRRLVESPERILGPHVREGTTVLEVGCGMGYFSLPLARMVGPSGSVVCVDVQPRMIDGLKRRARRAGLSARIEASVCGRGDLGLERWAGRVDLAVAIHVVHEVGDSERFLRQIHDCLRPGGALLLLEPKGHVSREQFAATVAAARRAGLGERSGASVRRSLGAVLERRGD